MKLDQIFPPWKHMGTYRPNTGLSGVRPVTVWAHMMCTCGSELTLQHFLNYTSEALRAKQEEIRPYSHTLTALMAPGRASDTCQEIRRNAE